MQSIVQDTFNNIGTLHFQLMIFPIIFTVSHTCCLPLKNFINAKKTQIVFDPIYKGLERLEFF